MGHKSDLQGEQEVRGHRAAHPGLSKGCGNTHNAGGDLGEAEASTKSQRRELEENGFKLRHKKDSKRD